MNELIKLAVDQIWVQLPELKDLRTPDKSQGSPFQVTHITDDAVTITTDSGNGSAVKITRNAFINTLHYLIQHQHSQNNPCKIKSSIHPKDAGPLCRAAREVNHGTRAIIYIIPILAAAGVLDFNGDQPNTTWLT